ncbi:hypothetical protein [Pantoea agglomerans]
MEVSVQSVIKIMRDNRLKPGKGHMMPTESKNIGLFFDEEYNIRIVSEVTDEVVTVWIIPQTIHAPSENQIENFEVVITDSEFISDDKLISVINKIVIKEYQKELIFLSIALAASNRGKAIILK